MKVTRILRHTPISFVGISLDFLNASWGLKKYGQVLPRFPYPVIVSNVLYSHIKSYGKHEIIFWAG